MFIILTAFALLRKIPTSPSRKSAMAFTPPSALIPAKRAAMPASSSAKTAYVVVDTFEDVVPAQNLLAEIQKLTKLPVRFVVNTHYHLDHTGGNAVFQKAGATILAQRNLRGWLSTENMKFFGANPKPEAKSRSKRW